MILSHIFLALIALVIGDTSLIVKKQEELIGELLSYKLRVVSDPTF